MLVVEVEPIFLFELFWSEGRVNLQRRTLCLLRPFLLNCTYDAAFLELDFIYLSQLPETVASSKSVSASLCRAIMFSVITVIDVTLNHASRRRDRRLATITIGLVQKCFLNRIIPTPTSRFIRLPAVFSKFQLIKQEQNLSTVTSESVWVLLEVFCVVFPRILSEKKL
jgi:hypothetical protein